MQHWAEVRAADRKLQSEKEFRKPALRSRIQQGSSHAVAFTAELISPDLVHQV